MSYYCLLAMNLIYFLKSDFEVPCHLEFKLKLSANIKR